MDADHGSMLKLYQFEIENSDDGRAYQAKPLASAVCTCCAMQIAKAKAWASPWLATSIPTFCCGWWTMPAARQWLTFVDPKGLRNLDLSHPKLGLYKEVKTLEATLAAEAKAGEPPLV